MIKGTTYNFSPNSPVFHITPINGQPGSGSAEVAVNDLKAMFVVKALDGNPEYVKKDGFQPGGMRIGRRLEVVFEDGEVLHGFSTNYEPTKPTFFLLPADPEGNNKRILVVTAAVKSVRSI